MNQENLSGENSKNKKLGSEKSYQIINWFGIVINFMCTAITGYLRGMQNYYSKDVDKSKRDELAKDCLIMYITDTVLLVISAIFLSDALRRLHKSF